MHYTCLLLCAYQVECCSPAFNHRAHRAHLARLTHLSYLAVLPISRPPPPLRRARASLTAVHTSPRWFTPPTAAVPPPAPAQLDRTHHFGRVVAMLGFFLFSTV